MKYTQLPVIRHVQILVSSSTKNICNFDEIRTPETLSQSGGLSLCTTCVTFLSYFAGLRLINTIDVCLRQSFYFHEFPGYELYQRSMYQRLRGNPRAQKESQTEYNTCDSNGQLCAFGDGCRTAPICALFHHAPCAHPTTAHTAVISQLPCLVFKSSLISACIQSGRSPE